MEPTRDVTEWIREVPAPGQRGMEVDSVGDLDVVKASYPQASLDFPLHARSFYSG